MSRHSPLAAMTALTLCALPSAAWAQSVVESGWALNRLDPAPAGERFSLAEYPTYAARWDVAGALTLDYSGSPLTVRQQYTDLRTERVGVVSSMFVAHLGASVSLLGRLGFDALLPVSLSQSGAEALLGSVVVAPAEGVSVGDARLGMRVRLFGRSTTSYFSLHVGAWLWLPSGSRKGNTGDGAFRFQPRLIMSGSAWILRWSLVGALLVRRDFDAANVVVSDELRVTAAVGVDLFGHRLRVGPEAYLFSSIGSVPVTGLSAFFAPGFWGGECLVTARLAITRELSLGAGVGLGFERGIGVPAGRALLSLTWRGSPGPTTADASNPPAAPVPGAL